MRKYILLMIFMTFGVFARYDETLPKGVRLLVVRQIQTDNVSSSRNYSGQSELYGVEYALDKNELSKIEVVNDYVLKDMRESNPEAYNMLMGGKFKFDVNAKVNVTGFATGYGITNNLTFYGIVPYYRARVEVTQERTDDGNIQEVNALLQNNPNSSGMVLDLNVLDIDNGIVQWAIQDYYGYEALGIWEAEGFGDVELGLKYKLLRWNNGGGLIAGGMTIPTGREDNPDIIQDFGFGTGFWGGFFEAGFGQSYHKFDFSFFSRVDVYLPTSKELRPSETNSDLTESKDTFDILPGPRFQISPTLDYLFNTEWKVFSSLLYEKKVANDYESQNEISNRKLERVSAYDSTMATLGVEFSTIGAYHRKSFAAPMTFTLRGDKIVSGTNIPEYSLYSAEIRLFF